MSAGVTMKSGSQERTDAIGFAIGNALQPGDIVRLFGELGAGKTTLVRAIARGMGIDPSHVHSPTYTIANEYRAGDALLVHIDAYRVDDPEETLEQIGLHEALRDGAVVCVEWPELLDDALSEAQLDITIAHAGPTVRELTLTGPATGREGGAWLRSIADAAGDTR